MALIRVLWIVGLSLVAWHWIYLVVALALLSVADVLFGMKYYHLHEECLASFGRVAVLLEWRGSIDIDLERIHLS